MRGGENPPTLPAYELLMSFVLVVTVLILLGIRGLLKKTMPET